MLARLEVRGRRLMVVRRMLGGFKVAGEVRDVLGTGTSIRVKKPYICFVKIWVYLRGLASCPSYLPSWLRHVK